MSTNAPPPRVPTDPPLECDLVMKGGITSGVVYPLAVTELASVYRLRSVGGSSAGAIAAAAAACAELGRASGGFEKLSALPHDLSARVEGRSRLFTLFQPQPSMRRLFGLVTSGLGTDGASRGRTMVLAALRAWWTYAVLGALPGVLLAALGFVLGGAAQWACLGAGLLLALVGLALGVAVGAVRDVGRIPDAGFGLTDGATQPGSSTAALTPWLHETFQALAGRGVDDEPVTFGELAEQGITLKLMTTNLSRREPLAMPWAGGGFWFAPGHFRALFPERVVARMEAATLDDRDTQGSWLSAVVRRQAERFDEPLRPFPAAVDLPVVVGVRMSLSFPALIAAVPLHAVDFARVTNQQRLQDARQWRRDHPDATVDEGADALSPLDFQRNWFSDGGICANLPLHFFDSALPRRPTFAIDLADFPVDRTKASDEGDNSYLPTSNADGLLRRQTVWDRAGLGALVQFFSAVVDTARTWVDEAQLAMPGYRDRIVTVFTDDTEGGLNLDMPEHTVTALSERGRGAAERLVDRFAGDAPGVTPAPGWDNHRWLRFRTATAAFSETLVSFRSGFDTVPPGTTPYSDWVGLDDLGYDADAELPSYPLTSMRRHAVNVRTHGLLKTADEWQDPPADAFTAGAPEPRPRMRLVPSEQAGQEAPLT